MHFNILEGEGPHAVKRRPVCLRIIDAGEIPAQMHLRGDVCPQRIHIQTRFSLGLIPWEFPHAFRPPSADLGMTLGLKIHLIFGNRAVHKMHHV